MQAFLSAENITKRFAGHTALNNVSISVPEKSIFGLLGPNGAGKTTLIRIITRITGPDGGTLLFEGEKMRDYHVQQIGYLPEERGLYKKMKTGEQAIYLARLKGMEKKEATHKLREWFEKFELSDWWDRKVEELSKGMQQKVQFISTVVHEPKLLILDEPFSGFDPINTNLIKKEILELRKNGATVIFSTHNMASVEEICDHIALLNKAEKILDGSVKEIKDAYKANIYEIEFKGNLIGFTTALWTGFELLEKSQDGEFAKVRVKLLHDNTPNQLLEAVLPQVEIRSMNEIIPSMNDIFIQKVTEIRQQPVTEETMKDE